MKRTVHSFTGDCTECGDIFLRQREFRSEFEAKIWKMAHSLRYPSHIGRISIGEQWEEFDTADSRPSGNE